jgi:hypothetical protein
MLPLIFELVLLIRKLVCDQAEKIICRGRLLRRLLVFQIVQVGQDKLGLVAHGAFW